MAETLKFGPEWLRALSDGTNVTSPPPSPAVGMTTYKLADHRYGREEMLALFATTREVPDELKEMPLIVSEKPLQPLALIPLSNEEQKLMTQSVNSLLALRMMGRGNSVPPGGLRGGRGGIDRGRGRGRGRGDGYYTRGFDDDPGHGRGRAPRDVWEEGRGGRYDRSFPPGRSFEDEVTPPPHREFSRSMSSENWRESKREDDDEGDWRRAHTRERWSSRNWREPRERFDAFEGKGRFDDSRDHPPCERGRFHRTSSVGSWDEGGGNVALPEWSTADVDDMDSLGTFDSSGAFMSIKQLEETGSQEPSGVKGREGTKSGDSNVKEKLGSTRESANKEHKSKGDSGKKGKEKNGFKEPLESNEQNSCHSVLRDTPNGNLESKNKHTRTASEGDKVQSGSVQQTNMPKDREVENKELKAEQQTQQAPSEQVKNEQASVISQPERSQSSVMETPQHKPKEVMAEAVSVSSTVTTASTDTAASKTGSTKCEEDDANFDHLEKAAENLVATLGAEEEKEMTVSGTQQPELSHALPSDHEDAKKWFYLDPQGDLQGPFMSSEMAEWFSAGYFTMNLMVKRGCDESFQPLGELIKSWGRIPFIQGSSPPPLKVSPDAGSVPELPSIPVIAHNPQLGLSAAAVAGMPAAVPSVLPAVSLSNPADNPEQLKALQQQQIAAIQQQLVQQQLLRQMQYQQILQQLQKRAEFANLPLVQQQLLLQQQMLLMQPQPVITQQEHLQQKLSPRSVAKTESAQHPLPQPMQAEAPGFHRTGLQPSTTDVAKSIWGLGSPESPAASVQPAWAQPRTVWDTDMTKVAAMEEIQRQEAERIKREREEHEANQQRLEEERRSNEERRKKELEEMERLEREKRERLEREKQEMLEKEKQKALERQREMERRLEQLAREEEEKRRKQQIEEQRRQEEEKRKMKEKERRKEEKLRQLEQEEQMKKELEEKKRQEEIKRRQQQAQHQEALRQMSREQLSNIQLPATAQWASSATTMASGAPAQTGTLSLAQIQQMEAERERKEQEERKLELQRQLMNAVQQQQQQQQQLQGRSWASKAQSHVPAGAPTPSLLEIQQEQARQLQENSTKSQVIKPVAPQSTSVVWGSSTPQSSNWAQEGAWGNPKTKATLGFWDEATTATPTNVQRADSSQKKGILNSSNFPSLSSSLTANGCRPATSKSKPKSNKDEETVQRLFQNLKPKDEFTQWCENALQGIKSNVDIPTFVAFLIEVESPYEVQEYTRSYLGETRETAQFARQFLEKRSKYQNQLHQQQQAEDGIWGVTPAFNPREARLEASHVQNNSIAMEDSKNAKKKKKRMQKLDGKCLGFTVHAAPDRHNIGEIETGKVE